MPQHFLRPRRAGSTSASSAPSRPNLRRNSQSIPRSVPAMIAADEAESDQSPAFTDLYLRCAILDEVGRELPLNFECAISRGFFKVKEDWICYRRNYINVTAQLLTPIQDAVFVRTADHQLAHLRHFAFVVGAVTATDPPRPIEMIQHTPKRDKGPQRSPEFVQVRPPVLRAEWPRLQYKVATANNGKKRGQQYFSLKVTMLGWMEPSDRPGTWIELGDRYSEPMIVRGRSPGHYNDTDSSYSDGEGSPPVSPGRGEDQPPDAGDIVDAAATSPSRETVTSGRASRKLQAQPKDGSHARRKTTDRLSPNDATSVPPSMPPPPHHQQDTKPSQEDAMDPHASFDPDEHIQLAPIRQFPTCAGTRPRLPTFDELQYRCHHPGSSEIGPPDLTRLDGKSTQTIDAGSQDSPELQAALSLASISGCPPIVSRKSSHDGSIGSVEGSGSKRSAVESLVSPRSSKSRCLNPEDIKDEVEQDD